MTKDIKIYVAYHKDSERIVSDILTPIHVGRKNASLETKELLSGMIGDDTGDNISLKNPQFCELTALYWAWKNAKSDYVGLFHYRRLFNFNDLSTTTVFSKFTPEIVKSAHLSDKDIERECSKYDIILPPVYKVFPTGMPRKVMTNYDLYKESHLIEHIDTLIEIINKDYPDFKKDADEYFNEKESMFFNMFVLRKDLFDECMGWMFDVLSKLEANIVIPKDPYQSRVLGFVAERLFNIFIKHKIRTDNSLKVKNVKSVLYKDENYRIVNFDKNQFQGGKLKYLQEEKTQPLNKINLVFSFDNKYAEHFAATLASVLLNSSSKNSFDVFVLDNGISLENKNKIERMKKLREFNVTYLKVDENLLSDLPLNRSYISMATYYRLLLTELLPENVDKIIYLDSDIIVEGDIEEFWNHNIEHYCAGVVEDEGSVSQCMRLGLPLKNNYFNAGVLLLNIKKLREMNFQKLWRAYFEENKEYIILQDQDILNGTLNGKCLFLPLKWNANAHLYKTNTLEHQYTNQEADYAAYNPAILHFTNKDKPWMPTCLHPLKVEYIKYLWYTHWRHNSVLVVLKGIFLKPYAMWLNNRKKIISIHLKKREKSLMLLGKYVWRCS